MWKDREGSECDTREDLQTGTQSFSHTTFFLPLKIAFAEIAASRLVPRDFLKEPERTSVLTVSTRISTYSVFFLLLFLL